MVEKNKKKKDAKRQRVWCSRNLGTISHKTEKYPSRQSQKNSLKKELTKDF